MDKRLLPLALGGLAIGTTEFTVMGLLPDIAGELKVTIPQAGHFISAYALGVVVGAPLLIGSSVRFPPKKTLIGLMMLFCVFNGLCAAAGSYNLMMVLRFLSGLPHGAFFGVGTVVASRIGGEGKQARSIALMFSGLTVANLAMVPLVTYIGHTFDWRWYFGIVAFIGLLTLISLYLWLPDLKGRENASLKDELVFLRRKQSWFVLAITAIGFGGLFTWFSYITPLMTRVSGFSPDSMAYIMILAGAGMVIGNLAGGYLTDRLGTDRTTTILLSAMMLTLVAVFFFSGNKSASLALTFACGALSMSVSAPINIMMMKSAPGSEMMAAAFMQAAFNVANSAGAFLGGIPLLYGFDYNYPSLVGGGMTLIGLLICITYIRLYRRTTPLTS
ncbi:MAG: MFS transporter [Chitinophagaceae bacterium]|nr:MAG: MFS transporter [Chitinophagaceae bacterium]